MSIDMELSGGRDPRVPQKFVDSLFCIARRLDRNDKALARRCVTSVGSAIDGNKHVGLWKVSCSATARDLNRRDHKVSGDAFLAVKMTGQVDQLSLLQARSLHILQVHKNNPPPVVDAAITIVQAIDRGVELIVTAHRRHQILSRLRLERFQLGNDELCLTGRRIELSSVASIVRQVENILAYSDIETLEAGNDMFDVIPNSIVVRDETLPIDTAAASKGCFREAANDRWLAHQAVARWLGVTARRTDDPHRVLDSYELLTRFLAINLRSTQARQDKGNLTCNEMRPVQLRRDMRSEPAFLQSPGRIFRVRRCRKEVTAHAEEELDPTVVHLPDGFYGVRPMI